MDKQHTKQASSLPVRLDPVSRKLYLVIGMFAAIVCIQVGLDRFEAYVLDSVRAYVAGEGMWSKGQKDASYHLVRYANSFDEREFEGYLDDISVNLGDHQARMALQASPPDIERARQGFLAGRNHPEDIDKMISLFLNFGWFSDMKQAIAIWTEGDANIARLQSLAESLAEEIRSGRKDPERIDEFLAKLDALNEQVAKLENRFSATLGDAARKIAALTEWASIVTMLFLLSIGIILSRQIFLGIRKTQRELEISEARFRRIVESNMIGIIFWTAEGEIFDANEAFLSSMGYSREELERGEINWRDITPAELREKDDLALAQVLEYGVCPSFEKEFLNKDGERVAVMVGAARFDDQTDRGVCFVLDIREQRRLEEQLKHTQKMESIGTLVGGIAHEFNNALAAMQGNLYLAGQHSNEPDILKECLTRIQALSEQSADMVRRLMTFASKDIRRMEPLLLNDILREVQLKPGTCAHTPPVFRITTRPLPVMADAGLVRSMLNNLLDNACHAVSGRDRPRIECRLDIWTPDPAFTSEHPHIPAMPLARLIVLDNGCGMDEATLKQAFDPFFTTREVGEGTGLGLSMVYGFVQSHHGAIEIDSTPDQGTSIQIYLPLHAEPADP